MILLIWYLQISIRHDINRKVAKVSALSSGKIDQSKNPTGEDMLPSGPSQIIQWSKFRYSPLGKVLKKKIVWG